WLRLTAFNLSLVPIRDGLPVPLPVPIYPSLGTGGNGMDKGDFRSSPAPGISAKIRRFSCSPAAAVTTYAAAGISSAGASAPAGFGGCAAMIALRAGTPPLLLRTPVTVNAISDMGGT